MQPTSLATRLVLAAALAAPSLAQDTPADGYGVVDVAYPGFAATATLASGDILSFDGYTVDRWDSAGVYLANYATFATYAYPSFIRVDPTESFAVIGESVSGALFVVPFTGAGPVLLATIPFNYDAIFETPNQLLVSAALGAALCGATCQNDLVRVDVTTGAWNAFGQVGGASGPLALDALGNLVCGTVSWSYPAAAGSSDVLLWTAAQLASSTWLDASNAVPYGAGFDGASSLAADPVRGHVYLSEVNYDLGVNRIRRVNGLASASPVLLTGRASQAISNLEFGFAGGGATFDAFQPPSGGTLRFNETDFYSAWSRVELTTARPVLTLSGVGTGGAGSFTVDLSGFPQLGTAVLVYGPSSLFGAELPLTTTFSPPLFTGFQSSGFYVHPVPVAIDGNGDAQVPFLNDGSLVGLVALQGLAYELGAAAPIGTSFPAFL